MSQTRSFAVILIFLALAAGAIALAVGVGGAPELDQTDGVGGAGAAESMAADPGTPSIDAAAEAEGRTAVAEVDLGSRTGVRGRVLDARTLEPLVGVEVSAMREPPSLERLITRLRSALFEGNGVWTQTSRPAKILGSATTAGDGSFEILGLPAGRLFLDARSDFTYVRRPTQVRLALGEVRTICQPICLVCILYSSGLIVITHALYPFVFFCSICTVGHY